MQVRDEEEEEAIEAVKRCRRNGDAALGFDDLKTVAARFSRLGKCKSLSGKAYRVMTKTVVVNGALRVAACRLHLITSLPVSRA